MQSVWLTVLVWHWHCDSNTDDDRDWVAGDPLTQEVFGRQYIWNLFSHNSDIEENGYNEEENKMIKETTKIFGKAIPIAVSIFFLLYVASSWCACDDDFH